MRRYFKKIYIHRERERERERESGGDIEKEGYVI